MNTGRTCLYCIPSGLLTMRRVTASAALSRTVSLAVVASSVISNKGLVESAENVYHAEWPTLLRSTSIPIGKTALLSTSGASLPSAWRKSSDGGSVNVVMTCFIPQLGSQHCSWKSRHLQLQWGSHILTSVGLLKSLACIKGLLYGSFVCMWIFCLAPELIAHIELCCNKVIQAFQTK